MSIIGVILCFRSLCQDALNDVLADRIPFLLSSIVDFKHYIPNGDLTVNEVLRADAFLFSALLYQCAITILFLTLAISFLKHETVKYQVHCD